MASTATLNEILKVDYVGPLREEVNMKVIAFARLEKNEDAVSGKNFTIPLHVGGNEGVGVAAENGLLPTAGNQQYDDCIVPMKHIYGRFNITGQAIAASKNSETSFVRGVESEMKGLSIDLRRLCNRMMYGDGSGILTVCVSAQSGTSITVASTKNIRPGMTLDILVSSTGATTAGVVKSVVASVVNATAFTLVTSVATAASIDGTYAVYISGARNKEMMGLAGIVSAGNPASGFLQGLDATTLPWWRANVLNNGGTPRAISEILLLQALDATNSNSNGDCTAMLTSYGVRRAYAGLLLADRVFQNVKKLAGGYESIDCNGRPLIIDKDAPTGKIYLLDETQLSIFRLEDFSWMDKDGAVLSRVPDKDAYEATMLAYLELGCSARNAQTLLDDLIEG